MRRRWCLWLLVPLAAWLLPLWAAEPAGHDTFADELVPLFRKYCNECHTGTNAQGGLALNSFRDGSAVVEQRMLFERIYERVEKGQMPPVGARPLADDDRERMLDWLHNALYNVDCELPDPGRVTMRRLNRYEYNNTIRDLLGVRSLPAGEFPYDDVGYGFDNIGDVLSLPVMLMEKYLNAAEAITEQAIDARDPHGERYHFEAEEIGGEVEGGNLQGGVVSFFTNGEVGTTVDLPEAGRYTFRARAYGQQAGPDPCRMAFRVDGAEVEVVDVPQTARRPGEFAVELELAAGRHTVAVAFINDYYQPDDPDESQRDRNFAVDWLALQGPQRLGPRRLPATHTRLIVATPSEPTEESWRAAAAAVIEPFGRRCWRRPLSEAELERLVGLACSVRERGETFERGIQLAVQAMLASPHFLFRVELDPSEGNRLGDWELASRLSYFLWGSLPDEALFAAAAAGRLRSPDQLAAQARRMLRDDKAVALTESFATQWLQLRRLEEIVPDAARFPSFDEALRHDLATETKLLFHGIVSEDRPVTEFLTADYTWLNERLAAHYGIAGVKGAHFRKVRLTGAAAKQRGGLLTHGSILTVTSNPTRTSPVKRGKYVLENILGAPPPDPPPGVPNLSDEPAAVTGATLREQMEQHREDPNCAVCHLEMDAIGFGFENYDAVGAWRESDGPFAIDPSGELPGGRKFADGAELRFILARQDEQFVRCLAEKLLTYALGRGLEYYDKCAIDGVIEQAAAKGYRFSALVEAVVRSDPFGARRPE